MNFNENTPMKDDSPTGTNIEDATKYDIPPIDPIVDFLSRVQIGDELLHEMDGCTWDQAKYDKYFKACDLFIIRAIIGEVNTWEEHDPEDPNYKAFNVLMKWFMYMIAVNPWWHRKLCYYNRMMGTNTNSTSYWHVQWHPSYVSGAKNIYKDNLSKSPREFNNEVMDTPEMYDWIDEYLCDNEVSDIPPVKSTPVETPPVKSNPTKPPRGKRKN